MTAWFHILKMKFTPAALLSSLAELSSAYYHQHVFLHLTPTTYNQIHVFPPSFPPLAFVTCFPALAIRYKPSRAWDRYKLSRARHLLHVFPLHTFHTFLPGHFYWFITCFGFLCLVTNLVTCLAVHMGPYPLGSWSPLSTIRWQSRYLNDSSASLASGPTPSRRPSTA